MDKRIFFVASLGLLLAACAELSDGGYYGGGNGGGYYPRYDRHDDDYYRRHHHDDDYYRYKRDEERYRHERKKLEEERERTERERRRLEKERHDRKWVDEHKRDKNDWQKQEPKPKADRCPSGFSPSERKCTSEERKRGCKDIRMDSGLGCVKR